MKGLELAEAFYREYGSDMIHQKFPEYESRIAVGLVGQGSECFGFDDEISTDHDFGPGFCLWLTDKDYESIGGALTKAYEKLPNEFLGMKRLDTKHGKGRVGVKRISDFYTDFIGMPTEPQNLQDWLMIPEHLLATATNGSVFRDDLGTFTQIREALLAYYPEDVRVKKIAARVAMLAQAGQYNYSRLMMRGELVGARLSLDEFIRNVISLVYLLNWKYAPFYKWMHRGMEGMERLAQVGPMLSILIEIPLNKEIWKTQSQEFWKTHLNTDDQTVVAIELICDIIVKELRNQGLTDCDDNFLETHTYYITDKIKDELVKKLSVIES